MFWIKNLRHLSFPSRSFFSGSNSKGSFEASFDAGLYLSKSKPLIIPLISIWRAAKIGARPSVASPLEGSVSSYAPQFAATRKGSTALPFKDFSRSEVASPVYQAASPILVKE